MAPEGRNLTAEDLRAIMSWLESRIELDPDSASGLAFRTPTVHEMAAAGLHPDGCRRLLAAPWWSEMVAEILETPELCGPDTPPETVLSWARDVPAEWIRKRFPLEAPPEE